MGVAGLRGHEGCSGSKGSMGKGERVGREVTSACRLRQLLGLLSRKCHDERWIDGWMDGWVDGWMYRQMNGQIVTKWMSK